MKRICLLYVDVLNCPQNQKGEVREQMLQIVGIRYWTVSGKGYSATPPSSSLPATRRPRLSAILLLSAQAEQKEMM